MCKGPAFRLFQATKHLVNKYWIAAHLVVDSIPQRNGSTQSCYIVVKKVIAIGARVSLTESIL
jgi:hypothetical protein